MQRNYELIMAGSGGQGLVFLSSLLAQAVIEDGGNVAQTQSYGIAQRGGFISAEIVASDEEILFQQVVKPSLVVVLHECAGSRYDAVTAPVLYDSSLLAEKSWPNNWKGVPFSLIAADLNAPKAANMAALGAIIQTVPVASLDAVAAVVERRFAPAVAKINLSAVKNGMSAAKQVSQGGRS